MIQSICRYGKYFRKQKIQFTGLFRSVQKYCCLSESRKDGFVEFQIVCESIWRRCEGNIEMDLIAVAWKGFIWIRMAEDREKWRVIVNTAMNCGSSCIGTDC